MYQPRKFKDPVPAYALALAESAIQGRLVLHAGSGVSAAAPTSLAVGSEVAQHACVVLEELIGTLPDCDRNDLAAVADALEGMQGGLDALKRVLAAEYPFTSADPSYGHRLAAMLLLEGVLRVLTTNWDNCFERGASEERVLSAIFQHDLYQVGNPVLKLHGCATQPKSMLVSTTEMTHPPPWVLHEAKARLNGSEVVFVGTGSPAGYISAGIAELMTAPPSNITVVAPGIHENWDDSWGEIAPDLDADRRVDASADDFLDALGLAYLRITFQRIGESVDGSAPHEEALQRVKQALDDQSSLFVLSWLRMAATPRREGSVVLSELTAEALIAIGCLGNELEFDTGLGVRIDGKLYSVLVTMAYPSPSQIRSTASNRLQQFLSAGGDPGDAPVFLVSAVVPIAPISGVADVVGEGSLEDVIDGPVSGVPEFVNAKTVLHNVA